MKLYSHPKCTTCKKAIRFLQSKKVKYQEINITSTPPSKDELRQMLELQKGDVRKLFNTSGMQYRALRLKEKIPSMSKTEAIELLAKNGMLVRRPFIIDKKLGLVGFRPEAWKQAFDD